MESANTRANVIEAAYGRDLRLLYEGDGAGGDGDVRPGILVAAGLGANVGQSGLHRQHHVTASTLSYYIYAVLPASPRPHA